MVYRSPVANHRPHFPCTRFCLAFAAVCGSFSISPSIAATTWNPANTYVLVASVTEWPAQARLSPFNTEKRRDEDLVDEFKKNGVPIAHIIFLKDSAATHAAIIRALALLA